jgi:competence protein ComEC
VGVFLAERERFVLWLPVLFGCGIAIYFGLPVEPPQWAGLSAFGALAVAVVLCRGVGVRLALAAALAVAGGAVLAQWRTASVAAPVLERPYGPAAVTGQVVRLERFPKGARVLLEGVQLRKLAPDRTPRRVRIRLRRAPDIGVGDWITVTARLMPPSSPAMPGAYDFQRRAWFEGIGAVGFALGTPRRTQAAEAGGAFDRLRIGVAALRQRIADRLRAALPGRNGAIAAALLVGDRSGIPKDAVEAMRESGLAHLLAISGLHMGLVVAILFFGVRLLLAAVEPMALRFPIKKWSATAALVGAFGYLVLAGATVPTQRAFVMTGLVLIAVLIDRKAISMRMVAAAAAAVLLLAPESLMEPGFQMSFAAVLALVAVYEAVGGRLARLRRGSGLRRFAMYFFGVALSTLIAGAATGVIALHHFGQVAQFGLVANLVAVPVTALWIMPWGVLACALMPFGLEWLALAPMELGIASVLAIAQWISAWPGAVGHLPAMPVYGLGLAAFGGLWLCLWRGPVRLLGAVGVTAGVLSVFVAPRPDVLVSDTGRLMAVRLGDGRLALSALRRERFVGGIWLERDGGTRPHGWPETVNAAGNLACDVTGCIYRRSGRVVALVRDGRALAEDCRIADIVISAVPVRRACRSGAMVIDRFDIWRNGAYALTIADGEVRAVSTRGARGERPWVRRPAASKRVNGRKTVWKRPPKADEPPVARLSTGASTR